jgi:IS30 family transposase
MLIVPSTKGSCFENITDDEIESMMNELNHRPRKTLNFKTPHAVFFAELLQEVV